LYFARLARLRAKGPTTYLNNIQQAAELLRAGKLVAFPTETVYGLGANALDAAAVRNIFEAKGRPSSSPLIVHVATIEMARELAAEWPDAAEKLARRFWPGPLTMVVPKKALVPDIVTAGLPSVGLRIPAHPMARALLEAAQIPIAAPSANRFTQLSPTTADHVRQAFPELFIVDGGACKVGIESTVISLAGQMPRILRPGMISQRQIEEVIGHVETGAGPESPGQHPRHYSPRTPVFIGTPPGEGRGARLDPASMPGDPAHYAERLYATLHDLDKQGYDWIAIELPPDTPEWAGVRDRLQRSAA
jgi:L-threonylcarbamoyladenylate synthase